MSRKILIASLGNGDTNREYKATDYTIEGKIYKNKNYVSAALQEHYNIDIIYYIGTMGSMWENIYSYYCEVFEKKKNSDYENYLFEKIIEFQSFSLEEKAKTPFTFLDLSKLEETFDKKIRAILTYFGTNDEEIEKNFMEITKILKDLQEGDELYLDITHSFRSNAFWAFLVLHYVLELSNKNIEVKMISYGMFEAIKDGNAGEPCPIINLNKFYEIMKWMNGANNLKKYGNADELINLIQKSNVRDAIKDYSEALGMNYIFNIEESIKMVKKLDKHSLEGPASYIIPEIQKNVANHFKNLKTKHEKMLQLAEWHYQEKRYALAYLNMNQALYNFLEEELYENQSPKKVKSKKDKKKEKREKENTRKKFIQKINNKKSKFNTSEEIYTFWKNMTNTYNSRNNIAHSDERNTIKEDIEQIPELLNFYQTIFQEKNYVQKLQMQLKQYETLKKD